MKKSIIEAISYIKSSKNRFKVVSYIKNNNISTPSEMSKDTKIRLNYISAILSELKEKDIVVCLNEDSKRGRLYQLTNNGKEAINILNQKEDNNENST